MTRPCHTTTDSLQQVLERLCAQIGSQDVDLAELVMLGAEEKERRLTWDSAAVREAREWLSHEILEGLHDPEEVRLADEVKYLGLIPNY